MLPCGFCKEKFASNDDLRDHLEGHESQMLQENDIKSEQDSDRESDQHSCEGGLLLVCVKEEEQLQEQQVEIKREEGPLQGHQVEIKNEEQHQEKQSEIKKEKVFEEPTSAQARIDKKRLKLSTKTPSEPFQCVNCSYKSKSVRCFNIHMNQMHLNKYKCDHCPKRYPSNGSLSNHVQKEHLEVNLRLPEDECFHVTMKKINKQKRQNFECLDFDQDSCEGSVILDCVKEEEHLQQVAIKTKDQQDSKESPSLPKEDIKCPKCSYETINKQTFKEHMNRKHLNKHKCEHCPKRYPSEGYLAHHILKEHGEDKRLKLPEDEFFCIKTTDQENRKRMKKLYECLKCTRQTRDRTAIYRHIRSVHKDLFDEHFKAKGMVNVDLNYYKCTQCVYKTLYKGNLQTHIKIVHQKRRDFACDLCEKSYFTRENLEIHMKRIHFSAESSEQHKCTFCSYKTIDKRCLRKHMNAVHFKIRKFSCDLCQMIFSTKSCVRDHIERIHLKENVRIKMPAENAYIVLTDTPGVFGCKCSFRTTEKPILFTHIRRVHLDIEGFSCDLCGKWYQNKSCLRTHMTTKHCKIY